MVISAHRLIDGGAAVERVEYKRLNVGFLVRQDADPPPDIESENEMIQHNPIQIRSQDT